MFRTNTGAQEGPIGDSNGTVSTGSQSIAINQGGNNDWRAVAASIAAPASGPTNVKTWDGVGIASIKTFFGLATGSTKTVDGVS